MYIFKWVVSSRLDLRSLEKLAQVMVHYIFDTSFIGLEIIVGNLMSVVCMHVYDFCQFFKTLN